MIILKNIYYSPQSKNSISLEVGEETKLLPDSAFENSLCTVTLYSMYYITILDKFLTKPCKECC